MHQFGVAVIYGLLATVTTVGVLMALAPEVVSEENANIKMGATVAAAICVGTIVLLAVAGL